MLDTPGMRELQLADATAGIADVFDDFAATAQECRFSNCSHGSEPGCAVRAAIDAGTLTAVRFERWRKLAGEATGGRAYPRRRSR